MHDTSIEASGKNGRGLAPFFFVLFHGCNELFVHQSPGKFDIILKTSVFSVNHADLADSASFNAGIQICF